MPTQITHLSFKEEKDDESNDSLSRKEDQNITMMNQLNTFGISPKKNSKNNNKVLK